MFWDYVLVKMMTKMNKNNEKMKFTQCSHADVYTLPLSPHQSARSIKPRPKSFPRW